MIRRSWTGLVCMVALAFTSGTTTAQTFAAELAPLAPADGTIYRLGEDSGHSEGCVAPCLCPVFFNPNIRGTYVLRLLTISQFEQTYAVEQVNWTVDQSGTTIKVKGAGTYKRSANTLGTFHRMELELAVGSAPAAKFDSGLQSDPNTFPSIDISVSDSGFCFARAFIIDSDPAPKKFVTRYALTDTTFQEGCYPPCKCPITLPVKVKGTFDLVLLEDLGTVQNFSITNVRWRPLSLSTSAADAALFTGTGDYTLIQGFAGPIHSMDLCLSRNGVELEPFSSGGLINTSPSTKISIVVSQHGMVCFDRVFDIEARPSRKPSLSARDR